jgi:hypothetical protein
MAIHSFSTFSFLAHHHQSQRNILLVVWAKDKEKEEKTVEWACWDSDPSVIS